ncbi:MAG: hypothetical protein J6O71_02590 [Lachnospiraceae bacterium]|nr:hypothetical protein [Lachnospiraceae bacterium]
MPVKIYVFTVLQLLLPAVLTFLSVFLRDSLSRYAFYSAGFILIISCFAALVFINEYPSFPYNNGAHPVRNCIIFISLCIISLSVTMLPEFVVPLSSLGFLFMILTSVKTGIAYSVLFSAMAMCAAGENSYFFIYYFLGTLILCFMYMRKEDYNRILFPLLAFAVYKAAMFTVICCVLESALAPGTVIAAAGGFILELVIVSVGLYRLRQDVVNRSDVRIAAVCDPEYKLLKELREESRDEFFRAVHTAYLCKSCAKKIGANEIRARALGYFHRIGVLRGDNMNIPQKTLSIALENGFEGEMITLIREFWELSGEKPISREASVAIICDDIVETIMSMFKEEESVDYGAVITKTMFRYKQNRRLKLSLLSLQELSELEACLKGEKLYYDFLR